jgi:hypothetical protein
LGGDARWPVQRLERVEEAVLPTPHQVDKLAGVIDAEGAGEIRRTVRELTAFSGT